MKQFFGLKEIRSLSPLDRKTYLGGQVIEITYKDGSKEEIPNEIFKSAVDTRPCDPTNLRDRMTKPVIEKILAILLELEVKIIDIDYIQQKLAGLLNQRLDEANTILWGKNMYDKTLEDVHKILTKNNGTDPK
jgi:hypothetical protein